MEQWEKREEGMPQDPSIFLWAVTALDVISVAMYLVNRQLGIPFLFAIRAALLAVDYARAKRRGEAPTGIFWFIFSLLFIDALYAFLYYRKGNKKYLAIVVLMFVPQFIYFVLGVGRTVLSVQQLSGLQ